MSNADAVSHEMWLANWMSIGLAIFVPTVLIVAYAVSVLFDTDKAWTHFFILWIWPMIVPTYAWIQQSPLHGDEYATGRDLKADMDYSEWGQTSCLGTAPFFLLMWWIDWVEPDWHAALFFLTALVLARFDRRLMVASTGYIATKRENKG